MLLEINMPTKINSSVNRRYFLGLSATLGSGFFIYQNYTAYNHEIKKYQIDKNKNFMQPTRLVAKDGLLDLTLTVSYFNTKLGGANPGDQYPVSLRAYGYDNHGPSFSGPTLVLSGGDTLRIKLINNLPVNPPFLSFRDPSNYMKPNTTNLHVHGLHVNPGILSIGNLKEFGDYVVDPNYGGVQPAGDSRQYVYKIPKDHPAGPFFYHPQFHGSSAIQTASLMTGAILVRGSVDDLPEMAQAEELVFLFQSPYFASDELKNNFGVSKGFLEKLSQIENRVRVHRTHNNIDEFLNIQPILINGIRQPTIVMESGEIQKWYFINTQIFNHLNLSLDDHTFYKYTNDGWGTRTFQKYPDRRQSDESGILLAPGNRSSVLIKAGEAGTYLLRSLAVIISQGNKTTFLPGDVLAKVVVINAKKSMELPSVPLPVSVFLNPISDIEFASAGGKKRSIIFNKIAKDAPKPILKSTANPDGLHANLTAAFSDFLNSFEKKVSAIKTEISNTIKKNNSIIDGSSLAGVPVYDYQLQPANLIFQNVILDSVEEWTVFNCNEITHSFHIHVNPMYIIKVNGVPVDPYWCDTVALPAGGTSENPTSITFRMRFKDFVGSFILHSQMLHDSDLGMIQRVSVVPHS
jgi:FtsP/CotA-like multicopper oxidase with cupredoxin domain